MLGPGCSHGESRKPSDNCFSVHYSLVCLADTSLSKLDGLGAHLSGAGLKIWGARCGVQTLCSSGRSLEFSPLPMWVMAKLCLHPFYPFQCGFFSFAWYEAVAQLILGFLSAEIVPQVATDSVCLWGGGEFRILLCQHLELEPRIYLDLFLSSVTSKPSAISYSFAINTDVQRFTSFHLCYLHPISSTRNHQDWPFCIHFFQRGESRSLSR